MLQISNSINYNKSIFRKLNPAFKFFIFIATVFLVFIPSGFFGQITTVTFIVTLFILSRQTKRMYLGILKTFAIMLVMFILINWITVKTPTAIYTGGELNLALFGSMPAGDPFIWNNNQYGNDMYISTIMGGQVIGKPLISNIPLLDKALVQQWAGKINASNLVHARAQLAEYLPGLDEYGLNAYLYMLNNPFTINNEAFKVFVVSNAPNSWFSNNILCNPEGGIIYQGDWYSMGPSGLFRALQVSLKIMMIIISSSILTATTTPSELTNGIEKIFSPFKIIKLPANECAQILSIGIRFIPSLLSESKRILNAQAARGLDYYNGNIIDKIKALVSLIIPLFSISIRKSDDLANAMDARGYNPRATRTHYQQMTTSWMDFVYLGVSTFVICVLAFMWLFNFTFLPFGIAELSLI